MTRTSFVATLLALGACAGADANPNYLGSHPASIHPGGAGGIGAGGIGAGGSAAVGGGGGIGASGTPAIGGAGGFGAAGTTAVAGTGGQPAIGGAGGGSGAGVSGMGGEGGGMGGSAGGPVGGTSGGPSMGTLTISFTTVSYNGEYAPLNYGAVWFEDDGGMFIRTAKRWAGVTHARDLVTWTEASGGWPGFLGGGGNAEDMMDAMSSATIRTHQMHTVTWDMKDLDGQLLPDGDYVAVLEMSEDRGTRPGPVVRIPFTKGPMPQSAMPPDQKGFMGISLMYQP